MPSLIEMGAKDGAALKTTNMNQWSAIPGPLDLGVYKRTLVYNCLNRDDVIYKGARPIMQESEPYFYREHDDYGSFNFTKVPLPGQPEVLRDAVRMQFNQTSHDTGNNPPSIDQPIYQISQAAQGIWYQAQNLAEWKFALSILYTAVIDGFGRQVTNSGVWEAMNNLIFIDESYMNNALFLGNLTDDLATLIYTDPVYGLENKDNYAKWDPLMPNADPTEKLLFKNELRFYFGLNFTSIEAAEQQWPVLFSQGEALFSALMQKEQKDIRYYVAYWQWCNSTVTKINSHDSVVFEVNTVVGYPELFYFKKAYFMEKIKNSFELYNRFKDINLYNDYYDDSSNFQYLFNLTKPDGSDPAESSLFNITTLQDLLWAGELVEDVTESQKDHLDLSVFNSVTQRLKLGVNERTYLIYMWLKYTMKLTARRVQHGGNQAYAVIPQFGAQFLERSIHTMETELPTILYTLQMEQAVKDQKINCKQTYSVLGLTDGQAVLLCSKNSQNEDVFNFDLNTTLASNALVQIYFNLNADFIKRFKAVLSLSDQQVKQMFFAEDSKIKQFIEIRVQEIVYQQYKNSACQNNPTEKICSNRELAFSQWGFGDILSNPLPCMRDKIRPGMNYSYVVQFPNYTTLNYTPELSYFVYKSGMPVIPLVHEDVWNFLNKTRLYELKIQQDILLNYWDTYPLTFTKQTMRRYIRFIAIEAGMGGMFLYRSPREYIEGYKDPTVTFLSQVPLYRGGDATTNPFLAINRAPTTPLNVSMSFFQGTDDYKLTRRFGTWLDQPIITMKRKDYSSISKLKDVYVEPWAETVYLDGTDGAQFHPVIDKGERLSAFVSDLARNGYFVYQSSDTDSEPGLEKMKWILEPSSMLSQFKNKDNEIYYAYIDGAQNMSTVLQAPALITKGHFYQLQQSLVDEEVTSLIVNKDKKEIKPIAGLDDTYLIIERNAGASVEVRQRIQMNFFVKKDDLYDFLQNDEGFIIPLTYIQRQSDLTVDQIDQILGDLLVAHTVKIAGTVFFIVAALLLAALGIFLLMKYRKILQRENGGAKFSNINKTNSQISLDKLTEEQA